MKILVAEDDQLIAESYKLLLESSGHAVVVTFDGEQCLDVFEKQKVLNISQTIRSSPFDLVILDYRMPKKSGIEVATHIRSTNPDQRILLATAYAHDFAVAALQKNEATKSIEVVQKPFEFDHFLSIVERQEKEMRKGRPGRAQTNDLSSTSSIYSSKADISGPVEFPMNEHDRMQDQSGAVIGLWP